MGRTTWFDNDGLKKGEWSAEEDRILVAYINEYGLGDWRTLPKRAESFFIFFDSFIMVSELLS
ncbi:hypothetical protein F2Q69_00050357 [Brassica cretica]|uniref:Myb-like domain-containing protein n=1 Tax=Brassica cretica TaxID=69181 RepID=A0A8S9PL88_BRACR|nr:hypothetical protein F2Q69_00050357 [Brassica cretica]